MEAAPTLGWSFFVLIPVALVAVAALVFGVIRLASSQYPVFWALCALWAVGLVVSAVSIVGYLQAGQQRVTGWMGYSFDWWRDGAFLWPSVVFGGLGTLTAVRWAVRNMQMRAEGRPATGHPIFWLLCVLWAVGLTVVAVAIIGFLQVSQNNVSSWMGYAYDWWRDGVILWPCVVFGGLGTVTLGRWGILTAFRRTADRTGRAWDESHGVSRPARRIAVFAVPLVVFALGVALTAVLADRDHSPQVVAGPLIISMMLAFVATFGLSRWAFPEWWEHRQRVMFPDRVGRTELSPSAGWVKRLLAVFAVGLCVLGLLVVVAASAGGRPHDDAGVMGVFALVGGGVTLLVVLPVANAPRATGQKPVSFWRFVFSKSGALIFLGGVVIAVVVAVVTEKKTLAELVGNAYIVGMLWWRWSRLKATAAAVQTESTPAVAPLLLTPDPTRVRGDCPTCRNPIPADSPHGLCPRCLIRGAMPSPSSTRLRGVSPIDPPTAAEVNEFFPHLEVLELIGAGGMGAVYTARQPALDRVVALKIVQSPRGDDDPVFAERFAREARAMAKLDHPNIVTIHESGEAGGLPFLLMEYIDGVTLREAMANRLLTSVEALAVIPQVCDALDFAHRAGIVHRDIKPENILIDQTGRVKIADFGLAKLADPKNVTLTRTQQAMGTPHYMAPEQWERPNDVDHRADVYALGVVLYELLTGELPLGRFALPSEKGKGDAKLDQVVIRALAKDPNERFQNAGQLKAALSGVKVAAFSSAVPPRRKGFAESVRDWVFGPPM